MNYTKGQWAAYKNKIDGTIAIDLKHTIHQQRSQTAVFDEIAVVFSQPSSGDVRSNANLIAAAPDMYEALGHVIARDGNEEIQKIKERLFRLAPELKPMIERALNKAEGK